MSSCPTPTLRALLALSLAAALSCITPGVSAAAAPLPTVPRITHPGAGQIFYFVLTDRFANGSAANDQGGYTGGPAVSGFDPAKITHYHGGDFAGLTAKLDYLKNLGVTAVWVTPPFVNKPMQDGTAGYHGYWITDFLHIDPHLGTDAEFQELVKQAHARGLKVYFDIIVNHTADVIRYEGGKDAYIPKETAPYRDAAGQPIDLAAVAYNGLGDPAAFPALSTERSFAYVPVVPPAEKNIKNPAWLNNPIYYHNRGNSTFLGDSALDGDFAWLDDLMTEHPVVVQGFIDIYRHWLEHYDADGFRIDTVKHANLAFWQAFAPAIRDAARRAGKPGFIQFAEVMEAKDITVLSEFPTNGALDATIDFGFCEAARAYVSQAGSAAALAAFFATDDYLINHANNAYASVTFLGNHDLGRFGYFLEQDNPAADAAQLADLVKFGHGLLFLVRGQPVVYYGDEQGMLGHFGNDTHAREDMFAAQAPEFRDARLLGTARTGAADKFDPQHPFYRLFRELADLRKAHPALAHGAMLPRATDLPQVFAFSRIERNERVEYLAVFNNSRTATLTTTVPTSQPAGAVLLPLYNSLSAAQPADSLLADTAGRVAVTLAPLQFRVWRAVNPLPVPATAPAIRWSTPAAHAELSLPLTTKFGHQIPQRVELRADVSGGDGFAEVTFAMLRASRPGQYELLGTSDRAPYRLFWRPPPDLAPGEQLTFVATVDDLRGHRASAEIAGLKLDAATNAALAQPTAAFGPHGAKTPCLTAQPAATLSVDFGAPLSLSAKVEGTGPLSYQWLRDGVAVPGATEPELTFPHASAALSGHYRLLARGLAGTVLSSECAVTVTPATAGRIETLPPLASQFLAPHRIDVWLPPGYDAHADTRYPVLYMHDGQNLFDPLTSYGGISWEVDQAAVRLQQAGKIPGVIIVGVWNNGMARFPEYMPQKAVTSDSLLMLPGGPRMAASLLRSDAYLKYLVEELKPAIDRTYRTLPDAAHTAIMGSSMGGLISGYALVEYPAAFGGAGCVSTHWPAGEGAVIDYFAQHLPKPGAHRLYFDYGTATLDALYEPYQQRMDAALRAAGYTEGQNWLTKKFSGAEHSEKAWRLRVEQPLEFLLVR